MRQKNNIHETGSDSRGRFLMFDRKLTRIPQTRDGFSDSGNLAARWSRAPDSRDRSLMFERKLSLSKLADARCTYGHFGPRPVPGPTRILMVYALYGYLVRTNGHNKGGGVETQSLDRAGTGNKAKKIVPGTTLSNATIGLEIHQG